MAGSNGKTPFNLDDFSDEAGHIVIKGVTYPVMQLDMPGWATYDRMRGIIIKARTGEAPPDAISTDEFYSLVQRVLPETPSEVVQGLTAGKAGMIIQIAANTLEAVADAGPKAEEPMEGAETLPPSSA